MKKLKLVFVYAVTAVFLSSCSDDNDGPAEPLGDYENGYFVTNEGPFQNGSGTITFVGDDGSISQNIYKTVNGEDLGNIVNSMYLTEDKGYIVVNNSNKVVVVNRFTMEKEAVISGENIANPRHFIAAEGKGFISNWGDPFVTDDDYIAVINLASNTVIETIPVGEGPEKMLISNSKLFVCLKGGYGSNNEVLVIDANNNTVEENIVVGDVPNSIIFDNNGYIRVLCQGNLAWTGIESEGSLYKIDPNSYDTTSLDFALEDHPEHLNADVSALYYNLNGKVYQIGTDAAELPTDAVSGLDGFYYAMDVQNGELYATDAMDFASEGQLKVFNISAGSLLETITTGIVPGQVVFP